MVDHKPDYADDSVPHVPDWRTLSLADLPQPDRGRITLDVWCSVCGQSGSLILDVEMSPDLIGWV